MKTLLSTFLLMLTSALCLTACTKQKQEETVMTKSDNNNKRVLVAFYSRTGENYGVGNIKKGNTHIVAEMIAEETGADLFEIEPVKAYPDGYEECTEVAKDELESNARPAIKTDKDPKDYDIIYIGYPIWWGDAPMVVYTWIENHDWHGKTVIPFCTHEGSGLGSSGDNIGAACEGSSLVEGFSLTGTTAQKRQEEARTAVTKFLKSINQI